LFIDYINTVAEIPALLKESLTSGTTNNRSTQLSNDLPRLLRLLPALFPHTENVQQVACLSDMLSALHHLAGQLSLANLVRSSFGVLDEADDQISRPAVDDSMVDVDRLHLLQSSAYDRFSATLEGLTA
jgi:nuclear pore complex protein Nup98-Nup96